MIAAKSSRLMKALAIVFFIGISIIKYFLISSANFHFEYNDVPVTMNLQILYFIYPQLDVILLIWCSPIVSLMIMAEIGYLSSNLNYDDNGSENKLIYESFDNYSNIIEKIIDFLIESENLDSTP